jgi:chromate transporter
MRPLVEVALLFLRLGFTAFGGPAAHIALIEEEVVVRRRWLTREQLLDFIAASNLIPGPNSTELVIHLGLLRAGWLGLLVAGVAFIVPAALMVGALAWAYVRWGQLPSALAALHGVKPVVLAIVAVALARFAKSSIKNVWLGALAVAAAVAAALGVHELAVLAAVALLAMAPRLARRRPPAAALLPWALPSTIAGATAAAATPSSVFFVFLKIGGVLFGSGYVLVAFLRTDLVERLRWLTETQLLDAVAVGQVTPGPLFTTATFVGYLTAGPLGAVTATVGIFLPAFVLVAVTSPLVPRLRRSETMAAALSGLHAGSLALMAVASAVLARGAIVDLPSGILAVGALAIIGLTKINPTWVLLVGGAIGIALRLI